MFKLKDYILEIEKTGSFSKAADNLYVSQPSLSASVKRLEERIGEPLFDRSMHPIRLTEFGEEYVRTARAIEAEEENFKAYLEEHRACQSGTLVLGGSNLNVSYVMPPLLKKYREAYPLVDVSIVESGIDDLQRRLVEGSLDLVIDSCTMDNDRINEYIYKPETLLLAVPSRFACNERLVPFALSYADVLSDRHTAVALSHPPLELLEDTPFIALTPETDTGKRSKNIFQRAGWYPNTVLAFSQQSTAFRMACSEIGATIVSDVLVKSVRFQPDLIYYKLNEADSFRFIKLYKKKGRRMSFAMRTFLSLAQESALTARSVYLPGTGTDPSGPRV